MSASALWMRKKARDVYDSIKAWTCKLGRIEKLYAFSYQPQRPEKDFDGWSHYDPREEWKRLGVSNKSTDKGWRISKNNMDYAVGKARACNICIESLNTHSFPLPILPSYLYHLQFPTIHLIMLEDTDLVFDCLF